MSSTLSTLAREARPHLRSCIQEVYPIRRFASTVPGPPESSSNAASSSFKKKNMKNPLKYRRFIRRSFLASYEPLPPKDVSHDLFKSQTSLHDLPYLDKDIISSGSIGTMARFPVKANELMHSFGMPRHHVIEFRLLPQPCSIVRQVTIEGCKAMDQASKQSSLENRMVLTGPAGCGKSILMMQIVAYCLSNNWIVMYIPRANILVNSTTPYTYDTRTRTYLQPVESRRMLRRMLTNNSDRLSTLLTKDPHDFEKIGSVAARSPLVDLMNVGLEDRSLAPRVLSEVMDELGQQTKYPVLFAVDDFQALYTQTSYRDPTYTLIRPYHLSIPRLIMEFANGKRTFSNGVFLGSLCMSNTQHSLGVELREALNIPGPFVSPHERRSRELIAYTDGLKPFTLPDALAYHEAAALFEVWRKTSVLHTAATDELFLSKYSESSGNARDFVRGGLLATLKS